MTDGIKEAGEEDPTSPEAGSTDQNAEGTPLTSAVPEPDAVGLPDGTAGEPDSQEQEATSEGVEGSTGGRLLDTEGEIAADYLEELLDVADLDGDIDTYVENDRAQVSVITESTRLIGDNGEVLEALQELTRLAVTSETGERSRLMLDVGGHREDRRRKLTELATDVVDEVKTSGESVRLDPMNPFERKIVHDAVAAAGLDSESDGVEPERRVVVRPAT